MYFSVAKLLSIAVITYSYVYHLRNPRPANLLRATSLCIENPCMRTRTNFILPETVADAAWALNLQDLKMADQKSTKTGKCRTWKMTDLAHPGTAKFCACLRKNAKEQVVTLRMYRTFNCFPEL